LVVKTVRGHFPPEFVNRIDEIVTFVSARLFDESPISFRAEVLTMLPLLAHPLAW
jgi:hypothetical protein